MIEELTAKFPLTEERITGEQRQRDFIMLFGAILRMRNLLSSLMNLRAMRSFPNGTSRTTWADIRTFGMNGKTADPKATKRTSQTILSLKLS